MAGPYTASELMIPSGAHTGVQVNVGVINISATSTAGAIIYLCRVPNHCTILDWTLYSSEVKLGVGQVIDLGTSASPSALAAGFSISESASGADFFLDGRWKPRGTNTLLPVRVSISDDGAVSPLVWLTAKLNAAAITSVSEAVIKFEVFYVNNGMPGRTTTR